MLLYFRSLPVRAAVRLSPGLPIKALDPVGTSFLLFITANDQEVTEILSGTVSILQHCADYTIHSPGLSSLKRPARSLWQGL